MSKLWKTLGVLERAILIAIGLLYIAFVFLDLTGGAHYTSKCLKYCGMLLVLAYAAVAYPHAITHWDGTLLLLALLLAIFADYYLLFTRRFQLGVSIFCFAHCAYIGRYRRKLLLPATLTCAALLLLGLAVARQHFLYAAAGIYALLFLCALCLGFRSGRPRTNRMLLRAGLILFLLCDIHVALWNSLPSGAPYRAAAGLLMWLFYLPGQALIAISARRLDENTCVNFT